jgi:hypothetical protein
MIRRTNFCYCDIPWCFSLILRYLSISAIYPFEIRLLQPLSFAQQLILSEEPAWSLADLLHTMVASTLAGLELREKLNRKTMVFTETIAKSAHSIHEANNNLALFFDAIGTLQPSSTCSVNFMHWPSLSSKI